MKVLPMQQPWASLVVDGVKVTETRDRHTSVRGRALILATRTIVSYDDARAAWDRLAVWRGLSIAEAPSLVQTETRGGIIGGVEIVDSVRAVDLVTAAQVNGWAKWSQGGGMAVGAEQIPLGTFGPGRRVWLLRNASRFGTLIECRGMPGWFDAPADVDAAAARQWAA